MTFNDKVKVGCGKEYAVGDYVGAKDDWHMLYFGHVPVVDMRKYTPEAEWQKVRIDMKGKTLVYKYNSLCRWLICCQFSYASKIQVTNYVTALSRGGLIKPEDYR